ncbi:MAG: bacterial Ig-like domain-containing protein [Clostridia bacterium]|nr:bacterial Ig-like domain-containing protein [Clostridia bacterium]
MKKLTKLLSVFAIAGALCAGVAGTVGAAGCNTDKGSTHQHIWGLDKTCTKCDKVITPTLLDDDDTSATPITAATYNDETGTAANVPDPNLPAYTGKDAALTSGEVNAEMIFDPAELSTIEYTNGWTDGVYGIANKTTVRGRIKTGLYEGDECVDPEYVSVNSVKLGDNTSAFEITVPAAGTLVFYVQNGSSGTTGTQKLTMTKPDGTETIEYAADGSASTVQRVTKQLTKAGKYTIKRASGTSDIFYAKFTTSLQQSSVESIRIANTGKTDYLVGQQLDCSAVAVVRKHATGATIPVSSENIQIDTSAYNPAVPGTYEIKVKYGIEGNLDSEVTEFEASYSVNVYDYEDLDVSVEHVTLGAVSAAGNSAYVNNAFRQFYLTGETFSTDGISLIVTGKLGGKTKKFKLDAGEATVTGADLTTPGVQTVKIAYTANGKTKAKGILITVREKPASIASEKQVIVAVNKEFAKANVGTKNTSGAYRFNTIQQALEFLEASELKADTQKLMYLAEGTYWEKVEVNVPNLAIIGEGADKTKIEYDALYGVEDAGGFTHVTDSTATLNVRDKAEGFIIKGVAISNYYNTAASYEGAPSNDCRALAMLIQADKVVVEDCTLLGYQDTLELFTGRQIFKNCVIKGVTDFIFGTNNTTYFYKCEIRNINHAKSGQPGYVTAFKGNNKGSSVDKVTYGAIFDDCDFTADEGVPSTCAMGRAWGPDAAVMIMNSRIGGHIAKTGGTSSGSRYISMGNGDPKNCQFTEYNNTGAGAITANLDTVKVLTEEQAKNYNDFAVIFGKVNNLLNYSDVWNVTKD